MSEMLNLPKPDCRGTVPLETAITQRRSVREYEGQLLTHAQVGQLCWAAQGQLAGRFRTVPSAGATYPLELYVVSAEGLFHYLPAKHVLEKLAGDDLRAKLAAAAWGQEFIHQAPATFVLAVEYARTTGRYGKRGIRYVCMEAGHAAQNVHLQTEALGLDSVAVGAFDDEAVSKVISLPKHIEPLYMVVVGYCRR